jgi:hypothetical protein
VNCVQCGFAVMGQCVRPAATINVPHKDSSRNPKLKRGEGIDECNGADSAGRMAWAKAKPPYPVHTCVFLRAVVGAESVLCGF